jgi:hypothetical protein
MIRTAPGRPRPPGHRAAARPGQADRLAHEPLVAALAYAVAGWPVLPLHTPTREGGCSCARAGCASAGKHPRTRRGLADATASPARITAWWKRWPDANVAVRTGGLVVVDADGPDGAHALAALEAEHGRLPQTRVARTSRGRHLYFHAGEHAITNSAGLLGEGLDVRGRGGYVVAPPSRHASGHTYTWATTVPVAPLPAWLARRLAAGAAAPVRLALPAAVTAGSDERAQRYLRAALEGEFADVTHASVGTRNATLNRAAFRLGQLAGAGLAQPDQLADALLTAASLVGLGEREERATIASGLTAGQRHPRPVPRG